MIDFLHGEIKIEGFRKANPTHTSESVAQSRSSWESYEWNCVPTFGALMK